jgi:cyclophilin family peptidyl-prolyl cis-trans isomerase
MPKKKSTKKKKTLKASSSASTSPKTTSKPSKKTLSSATKKSIAKTTVRTTPVASSVSVSQPTGLAKVWQSYRSHPESTKRTIATVFGVLTIAGVIWFNFYAVPNMILTQRDSERARIEAAEAEEQRLADIAENERRLEVEDTVLQFDQNTDWTLEIEFADQGAVTVNTKVEYAPETVENFVRLAYRGYFDDTPIHRMVKQDEFNIIQGGDGELRSGLGGQSAFYISDDNEGLIPDEQWLVEPELSTEGEVNVLVNEPQLRTPSLYGDFRADDGTIVIPKGTIVMARETGIDTASSQFFITLTDTRLPAIYTAFGTVDEADFGVLDSILANYNPVTRQNSGGETDAVVSVSATDGEPDPELRVSRVFITAPEEF